jgi:cell wall-associated NlpC family hydrolase
MNAYFNTADRRRDFVNQALSWERTPFVPHANIRGAGVDCVNLGREVYRECGLTFTQGLPNYTMDGGKHNAESQLIRWLEMSGQFVHIGDRTKIIEVQIGDTLCFKLGRSAHHSGFAIGGTQFINALFKREFRINDLRDKTFVRILAAIYRPVEVAL